MVSSSAGSSSARASKAATRCWSRGRTSAATGVKVGERETMVVAMKTRPFSSRRSRLHREMHVSQGKREKEKERVERPGRSIVRRAQSRYCFVDTPINSGNLREESSSARRVVRPRPRPYPGHLLSSSSSSFSTFSTPRPLLFVKKKKNQPRSYSL